MTGAMMAPARSAQMMAAPKMEMKAAMESDDLMLMESSLKNLEGAGFAQMKMKESNFAAMDDMMEEMDDDLQEDF